MQLAVEYLEDTLSHIRAGKASARLLDGIRVDYYGSMAPISNVANVSVPDARTIAITPWEKNMFREIEKAIINSDLGITPENNAKVSVRNARRDTIDALKKAVKNDGMAEDVQKDGEAGVQKLHDRYIKRIDEVFSEKEKEILTV